MTATMERDSLSTAATYINNLLLARGLLRNGQPVDFCSLATDTDKKRSREPKATTTAQVINLVHDLILRRDRDQTHLESLSTTIATLNTDKHRLTTDLERTTEQNRELRRKVSLLEQSERNAQSAVKSAETSAKQLRDEVQKAKVVLSQVRAQCNTDLRKRDIEMTKLKTHLSTQQRGANSRSTASSAGGPSCTISFGRTPRNQGRSREEGGPSLEDAAYSLQQETTAFLTELSQGLSDENDALITLVRNTVDTLRALMGLPHNRAVKEAAHDGSELEQASGWSPDGMVFSPPTSYNELTRDTEMVLSSLKELLTNPAFAPIEEVHVREEEIQRLRHGWEQMETRWKEAVIMMSKWTTRMQNGGDSVNVAELKAGLRLGEGLRSLQEMSPSPARTFEHDTGPIEEEDEDSEVHSLEVSSECGVDQLPEEESPLKRPEPSLLQNLQKGQLLEVNGNVQLQRPAAAKKTASLDDSKENKRQSETSISAASEAATNVKAAAGKTRGPNGVKSYMRPTATASSKVSSRTESRLPTKVSEIRPRRSCDRESKDGMLTRQKLQTRPQNGPDGAKTLSVREKLNLAEEEARRVSSSSPSEAREPSPISGLAEQEALEQEEAEDAELLLAAPKARSQVKRTKISGKPRRRKSTLTPEELDELMLGGSQEEVH